MADRPGRGDRFLERPDLFGDPPERLDAVREGPEELEKPFAEESAAWNGFFL
jgi:hypothetical protein